MTEWDSDNEEAPRYRWYGSLLLMVSALASIAAVYAIGLPTVNLNRAVWTGFGLFLLAMTVTRPWWFWEHYKARMLRRLIGDGPVIVSYLGLAAAMIWIGLFTDWTFGKRG
jgi:hypothetical protein